MDARQKQLIIMYHEIKRLREVERFSIQRIADHYSMNFRTVKKLLTMTEEAFDEYMEQKSAKSRLLDPYRDFIVHYLKRYEDSPSAVIHDRLKEHYPNFPMVDPKTVYNYVMQMRLSFNIPKVAASQRQYAAVPDLPPGEQAQVDFGQKKLRTSTGQWVKVHLFTMLLCYSRQKFALFQSTPFTSEDAIKAHEKAFAFFKGIPREILYDQDSVFLFRENAGEYKMTDVFDRYQQSRPFKVIFCRAADPESKGKVENVVKYLKQNFLFHRTFINNDLLNEQALGWLNRTGNAMVHGTTRKIPHQQWLLEQPQLLSWMPLFPMSRPNGHKVLKTNSIKYRGNSYSLPFGSYKNEQTKVYVTEKDNELVVHNEAATIIATHLIPSGVGNNVVNTNHRRDTSVRLESLREKVRAYFLHSSHIKAFVEQIDRLYPRYVRDQLTSVLTQAEKGGRMRAEMALAFCVQNSLFSAGDFQAILLAQHTDKKPELPAVSIKPLGDAKTQLMVNMQPKRSDIGRYELIFNQNTPAR